MMATVKMAAVVWMVLGLVVNCGNAVAQTTKPVFFELCKTGTVEQVRAAIAAGADVNAIGGRYDLTPLMYAASGNPDPEVITVLLKAGAEVNARDRLIRQAGGSFNPKAMPAQVKVSAKANYGMTPLMFAAQSNPNPEAIGVLLKAGADINAKHPDGSTMLVIAAAANPNPRAIEALVTAGADVNAKGDHGKTPLMCAAQYNRNPEMITALVKAGADVNAKTADGKTALMLAVGSEGNRNPEVIAVLVKAGAGVNAKDANGKSVLEYGRENTNPEFVEKLVKAGAK